MAFLDTLESKYVELHTGTVTAVWILMPFLTPRSIDFTSCSIDAFLWNIILSSANCLAVGYWKPFLNSQMVHTPPGS